MQLTDEDVTAILKVLETTQFGELELEIRGFRLSLRRTADGGWVRESNNRQASNLLQPVEPILPSPGRSSEHAATAAHADDSAPIILPREIPSDLLDVHSPLPGTFYRAPKPGSAPFVEVGSMVGKDTVIGIVETMKLMNSVYAGVKGRIAQICLGDGAFTSQETVLMRIELDTR